MYLLLCIHGCMELFLIYCSQIGIAISPNFQPICCYNLSMIIFDTVAKHWFKHLRLSILNLFKPQMLWLLCWYSRFCFSSQASRVSPESSLVLPQILTSLTYMLPDHIPELVSNNFTHYFLYTRENKPWWFLSVGFFLSNKHTALLCTTISILLM